MKDNVIVFPSIFEQKSFIDLNEASQVTGLKYSKLYKMIVIQNKIGYFRFDRKILLLTSDVQNLMKTHFIGARK